MRLVTRPSSYCHSTVLLAPLYLLLDHFCVTGKVAGVEILLVLYCDSFTAIAIEEY
jgi:hypothetical protein